MKPIWEFFQKLYWDAYDLPSYYLGIEGEITAHIFTVAFLLLLLLAWIYIIKLRIDIYKIRKDSKAIQRRIDKLLIGILEDKNKKEKTK